MKQCLLKSLSSLAITLMCSSFTTKAQTLTTSSSCTPAQLTVTAMPMPYMLQWQQNGDSLGSSMAMWDTGKIVAQNGLTVNVYDIAIDTAGNLYVENNGTEVVKYPKGSNASTAGVVTAENGIQGISDIRVDIAGNLFVLDYDRNQVLEYPTGSNSTTSPIVVASGFLSPDYLFVDNADNIYLSDEAHNEVWYYQSGDTIGTVIAQNGILSPAAVFVDNSGNLFVSDADQKEVLEYPKGSNSTTAGTVVAADELGNSDELAQVVVDGNGNLYVQDPVYNGTNDSSVIYIYPKGSNASTAPVDSIMLPGALNSYEFYMDASGNIYAPSAVTNVVKKYSNIIVMTDSVKTGGNYTAIVNSFSGSFDTLSIMIGAPDTSVINRTVCDSLILNSMKYTSSGTYTQMLTNKSGCDSTLTLNLTVNTTPTVTVSGKDTILMGGSDTLVASGATTYSWNGGGTSDTLIVSPSTSTSYTVTGASSGCNSTVTFTVNIEILSGIQAITNGDNINLYPNPANTYVKLSFSDKLSADAIISIVAEAGQVISTSNVFVSKGTTMPIDISNLAAGVYFVKINTAGQTQVVRFVKSN
ncbi:MAG: T9SS type A sorting domain-containing protein [Bacteroidia bacterium]